MPTANHFRIAFNFTINNSETAQCGFTAMASDVTLPVPYAVNADLPTKDIIEEYGTRTDLSGGTLVTPWQGAAGTSLNLDDLDWLCANYLRPTCEQLKVTCDNTIKFQTFTITPYNSAREVVVGPAVYTPGSPITGSASSNLHPWFASWAIGWRGAASGPSQRGRLYWPATAVTLTSSTRAVSQTTMDLFLSEFSQMFQSINDSLSFRPVIVHGREPFPLLPRVYDKYSDIVALRINNNLDTMKTRGNSFPKTYQDIPIAYS